MSIISDVEPGNSCDFEDENICGWKHDIMVRFKWTWKSGTTPTRRTGPSYDHTLGKDGNGTIFTTTILFLEQ